jgi:hypothetical protein
MALEFITVAWYSKGIFHIPKMRECNEAYFFVGAS